MKCPNCDSEMIAGEKYFICEECFTKLPIEKSTSFRDANLIRSKDTIPFYHLPPEWIQDAKQNPDAMVVISQMNQKIIHINTSALNMFNCKIEQIENTYWNKWLFWDSKQDEDDFMNEFANQGLVENRIVGVRQRDNNKIPAVMSALSVILFDEKSILCILHPQYALLNPQEILIQSERKYRVLYESIRDGIALWTIDGRMIECNSAFAETLGYEMEEMKSVTISEVILSENIQLIDEAQKGHPVYFEGLLTECRKKGGEIIDTSLTFWIGNEIIELKATMWTVIRDMTELLRTQKQLSEEREKYRTIFEGTSEAILIIDPENFEIVEANPAALELYQYTKKEILTKKITELSAEPEKTDATLKDMLGEGKTKKVPLRWYKTKEGIEIPLEITLSCIILKGEQVVCVIIRDISETIKQQEKQLMILAKMKTMFKEVNEFAELVESDNFPNKPSEHITEFGISNQEERVVFYVLQGMRNKEIAGVLSINEDTVKKHLYSVYKKLHINSRIELVNLIRKKNIGVKSYH